MVDRGEAPTFPYGSCDVTVTGAVELSYRSGGGSPNVASVYWMTDDELREYFAWKARNEARLQIAEDDIPLFVDQAMARNPRFTTLLIMCPSEQATVTLVPGVNTRYEDVPFHPGSYGIAPSTQPDEVVPGLFAAQTVVVVDDQVVLYVPTGAGALTVTTFDPERLAGEFTYDAKNGDSLITVHGVFDFRREPAPASQS